MSDPLARLEPRSLWRHFSAMAAIPRPSREEERIVAWVRDLAAQCDHLAQDDIGLSARPVGQIAVVRDARMDRSRVIIVFAVR